MVDKIHKASPNMSLYRAVQVVQFRKNAKCLGATTVEDIYKAVEKLEGKQFADEYKDYSHGRHKYSLSQREEERQMKAKEAETEKRRNTLTTVTKGRRSTHAWSDWTGRLHVPAISST